MTWLNTIYECEVWIDKSVPRVTVWHHTQKEIEKITKVQENNIFIYNHKA